MLGKSISRNSMILAVFALVTAGVLALIHSVTKDRIKAQQKIAAEKALLEIVPRSRHDNAMLEDLWPIPKKLLAELDLLTQANIFIASYEGAPVALIIPATAKDGYSGDIDLLIGINNDASIAGVRVIQHKETPGLGDKIDLNKSDWIRSFDGLSLSDPQIEYWRVKKDGGVFDQFTGATITPRAVVNRVKETLEFFEKHKHIIFENSKSSVQGKNNHG